VIDCSSLKSVGVDLGLLGRIYLNSFVETVKPMLALGLVRGSSVFLSYSHLRVIDCSSLKSVGVDLGFLGRIYLNSYVETVRPMLALGLVGGSSVFFVLFTLTCD